MERKIFFFDLDGTLMQSTFVCYPEVSDMLDTLRRKEYLCFACTRRGDSMVPLSLQKKQ